MGDREGKKQRDIRDWISSPGSSANGTPARRRRVMSTSDSEAERNLGAESQQQQPHHQNANMINDGNPRDDDAGDNAQGERQVIQLDSSSDDSMYLPFPRQQGSQGAARPASHNHLGLGTGAVRNNQRGSTRGIGKKRSKKSKPKFCAEAEETDTTEDSSDCAESDPDAQCLYRQAMNGVRNAKNARTILRGATMNCPVCAKFAAYLQHFLPN